MRRPGVVVPAFILAVLTTQHGMAWAQQAENQTGIAQHMTGQSPWYVPTLRMREQEFREFVAKIRSHLSAERIPFYGGRPDDCDASRGVRVGRAVWAGGIAEVSVPTSVISCEFDFRGGLTPSGVAPLGYVGFTVLLYAAPYTEIAENESNAHRGQNVTLVVARGLQDTTPTALPDDIRVLMRGVRLAASGEPLDSPARIAGIPCESYTEPLYTSRTIEQPIDVVKAWSEFFKRLAKLGCFPPGRIG